ncbi:hypothetical protein B0H16DRAFT_1718378 [Mycena metata]|uniref:Uncharacterized protein n=1 Tax=Mycena metata TaxID=1033252 RepID=A0AAD7JHU5_9AGAR|nr:hypothetical protein B0H16DRAFT_1718378 [Mycena metata]
MMALSLACIQPTLRPELPTHQKNAVRKLGGSRGTIPTTDGPSSEAVMQSSGRRPFRRIQSGPSLVGLANALDSLHAMQERDAIQRHLDELDRLKCAAALENARLQAEAEVREDTWRKELMRRHCVESPEYLEHAKCSHERRVAAKDAEAAAWRHAFEVARRQGTGTAGAPGAFLRKKYRAGQHPTRTVKLAVIGERLAWKRARCAGVGVSAAPGAVLRKKKYRIFSPSPEVEDHPTYQETPTSVCNLLKGEPDANAE